jgi:hypothetical protein
MVDEDSVRSLYIAIFEKPKMQDQLKSYALNGRIRIWGNPHLAL